MFNKKTVKKAFNEGELKAAITEMPQRIYDALVFEIEAEIYTLEVAATPSAAVHHGAVAHMIGGIYSLRNLLDVLVSNRELKE